MCDRKTNFGKQDGVDLRDLLTAQIDNIHTLIEANDKAYNQRFDNVVEATKSALAAADRAVTKAEGATEKRFEGVNEFRNTLADQQRSFMPRNEVDILVKGLNDKIDALNLTTISRQSEAIGQKEGIGQVAVIAGVTSAIIAILSRLIK